MYKAISKPLGENIAVKQIDIDGMTKEQLVNIRAEIETMKSLSHPNIVSYLGMQLRPNKVFILMEFASLGSLRHHYQRTGPFSEKYVRYCLEHIVSGLHYLHSNGIAHRDVKCANCLISDNGVIKLADFGASKRFESQSIVSGLKGTPHWMAPEVIKGTQMTTGWIQADVWSLGCTVVEMYTGKVPYAEYENPMTAMYKIANGEIPSLQRKNSPGIIPAPDLVSFVRLCCAVDPTGRPSLQELAGHPFLSSEGGAVLSSNEIQAFFSPVDTSSNAPLVLDGSALMETEVPPDEVQHSEMFSPDPSTAHVIFSSMDSAVATFNNSGSKKLGLTLAGEEEQHYEDDWSDDGELNDEQSRPDDETTAEGLSRCQTRQAHASPNYSTSNRLELPSSAGITSSSSSVASLDLGELPTPLMGAAGRKGLVRYESEASIGERTSEKTSSAAVKQFEVPPDLVAEIQSMEERPVQSFEEANQVYLAMLSKYGTAGSENGSSEVEIVKPDPAVSSSGAGVIVAPNLSPVKVAKPTSDVVIDTSFPVVENTSKSGLTDHAFKQSGRSGIPVAKDRKVRCLCVALHSYYNIFVCFTAKSTGSGT